MRGWSASLRVRVLVLWIVNVEGSVGLIGGMSINHIKASHDRLRAINLEGVAPMYCRECQSDNKVSVFFDPVSCYAESVYLRFML
jgi:hypothetical protein